ncbi:hypothetical protein CQW23_18405 [Capsicum baccatum]|uniref:Uncharacterized protein n=1 Tax=Capsicum baccatum TaxID=33114 RepID=A0A2G2W2V1_CAPBA|nr:hypothetical protein CQW23_18405 [Capsicum baccatum]
MVENERKNNEDLEVETGLQATGATGVNNVESTQGEDWEIVPFVDPKPVGTSTENSSGESILKDPSACKAIVLSEASDEPETMLVPIMNDSDDELTLTEIARVSKSRGQKNEVHLKGPSNSTRKRKRSMNDGQMTSFIPELSNPGNRSGIEWSFEDDFCSAFYTDDELCLNVVCAFYRQQISGNIFSSMSKIDKNRITALGVFLCRDDPKNKLKRIILEVGPEDLCICMTLAIRYFRQIYRIYNSKKDQLFRAGVDLEVETARQAPGAAGVNLKRNNVESSQGKDRAIVLFDDPKRVGTSTRKSSGQSRLKETMSVRVMNDNDDDMTLNEIARCSKRRGQKKVVHVKGSSNSMQKRKRSMNDAASD